MPAIRMIAFSEASAKINTIYAKFNKEGQAMSFGRKVSLSTIFRRTLTCNDVKDYWNCLYITNTWRAAHIVPVPVVPMGFESPDDNAAYGTVAFQLDVKTFC